ncbi:MAG: hypothetical protein WAO20_07375 [Acidobacteriota bacterium]
MKLRHTLLVLALLAVQIPAFGAVTRWTLSGVTFSDGGTAEGFFDLNAAPGTLGVVENWQITVSGGNAGLFPEFTYTPENTTANRFNGGNPQPEISFNEADTRRQLRVTPVGALTDAGGVVDIDLETAGNGSGSIECFNCAPARVITAGSLVAGSAQETLLFPQFGNGAGLISDLVLTNTTSSEATARVEFRGDNGNPLDAGIARVPPGTATPSSPVSTVDFSVPAFGTVTISTDGQGNDAAVGSAVVLSDRRLGGVVRFRISGIGIAGVGSAPALSQFVVPVRRTAGVIDSGLAMRNTGSTPVQIQMTLRNAGGTTVPNGSATIADFPASGHVSHFIEEYFPDAATDNFEGSVQVEVTGGYLAATALELGNGPGEFTTLPVINLLGQ